MHLVGCVSGLEQQGFLVLAAMVGVFTLTLKTHKKASKAASYFCKVLLLNKLNFTKRTPLR
jgi:hypothetical protein